MFFNLFGYNPIFKVAKIHVKYFPCERRCRHVRFPGRQLSFTYSTLIMSALYAFLTKLQ